MALHFSPHISGSLARFASALLLGAAAMAFPQPSASPFVQPPSDKGLGRSGEPLPQGRPYLKIHALFVGIDDYKNPVIPDLRFAEKDAQAVMKILVEKYGFAPGFCRVLLGAQASRENLEEALTALADDRRVGPGDAIFVYISGHGIALARNGVSRGWLVPQNASIALDERNPSVLDRDTLPYSKIVESLTLSSARHSLVVLDSCYAGSLVYDKGPSSAQISYARNFGKLGREVLAATDRSTTAKENGELRHGHYTYYFLRALRERAGSAPFFALELQPELDKSASTATQSPVYGSFNSSEGGSFLFSPAGSAKAFSASLAPNAPARLTGLAEAEQAFFAGRWADASGVLEAAAAAGNPRAGTLLEIIRTEGPAIPSLPSSPRTFAELAPVDPAAKLEYAYRLFMSKEAGSKAKGLPMLARAAKELRETASGPLDELVLVYAARSYRIQAESDEAMQAFAAGGVPGASFSKAQAQAEALKLARRAAQTGSLISLLELQSYLDWAGDLEGLRAVSSGIDSILKRQADGGDLAAHYALLDRQSPEAAATSLRERLERLDPDLSYQTGMRLANHEGAVAARDIKTAGLRSLEPFAEGTWMSQAVGFGDGLVLFREAEWRYGVKYRFDGETIFERFNEADPVPEALPFLKSAADRGHGRASYVLGMILHKSDPLQSLDRLRRAADLKVGEAFHVLIEVHTYGLLSQPKDMILAVQYARKGADLGDGFCCLWMGIKHRYGSDGVERNWSLAKDYFLKGEVWPSAADLYVEGGPGLVKNWKAAHDLFLKGGALGEAANLLEKGGFGLAKDETAAFALRLRYAEMAPYRETAFEAVAERYEKGILGAPKDTALAIQWWRKAKEKGSKLADEALKRLSSY